VNVCDECGFDWDSRPEAVISEVGGFGPAYRAQIEAFLHAEGGNALVRTRPAPGVWSALEYAAHMRDVVRFYRARIGAVVERERPRMHAANFAAMVEQQRYNAENASNVTSAIEDETVGITNELMVLSPTQWQRVGIGSEGGERSVLALARRLAHDGHHHLLDLENARRTLIDTHEQQD
jgi:hypothetical protein